MTLAVNLLNSEARSGFPAPVPLQVAYPGMSDAMPYAFATLYVPNVDVVFDRAVAAGA